MRETQLVKVFLIVCGLLNFYNVIAQEKQIWLETFKKNFVAASDYETKFKVLEDAKRRGAEGMGSLFHMGVDFVITRYTELNTNTMLYQIAILSNEQLKVLNYMEAGQSVWELFKLDNHVILLINLMESLSSLAQGDKKIVTGIIDWLTAQNSLFHSNNKPNNQVVAATVNTLGKLKDKIAFNVLFKTRILGYSEQITKLAEEAIFALNGEPKLMLMAVIEFNPMIEKWHALNLGLETGRFNDTEKAELAEKALDVSLHKEGTADNSIDKRLQRDIRFVALKALAVRKWSKVTSLAIEHFNLTLAEYTKAETRKDYLLDAIAGLGSMGTREAAERLSNYLELLNNYTEHNKPQDEQIVATVVQNLGILGDKVAFPNLSYTQYLNYPEKVKKIAEDAITKLKW